MKRKILVVDDEPDMLELVKNRLEASEYEVSTASNGIEGIESLQADKPHLVILDMMMPLMNGTAFLKKMQDSDEFKSIPVMVLTAKPDSESLLEDNRPDAFMTKPFDPTNFMSKVSELMQD